MEISAKELDKRPKDLESSRRSRIYALKLYFILTLLQIYAYWRDLRQGPMSSGNDYRVVIHILSIWLVPSAILLEMVLAIISRIRNGRWNLL